jgi:iron complex transport system ATP-binding protein
MIKVEMQKVTLGYGHKAILKDIDLYALPGEMVGLIGPNGCGKSTIIRALSHVITPLSGKIFLDGRDLTTIPRRELARLLGVVPQMPLLPSAFTAFEIVLMGRNPHLGLFQYEGVKDQAIAWQAMERTGTTSLSRRRVSELSGGEIQCLLVARALTQETKVILLDEPTANLDIGRQTEILDLMKELCLENNLTVLTALHDLNLAAQYCDRLVMLHNGQVHAEGKPEEVITPLNIREVYGAEECVYPHPLNSLPTILLTAGKRRATENRQDKQ